MQIIFLVLILLFCLVFVRVQDWIARGPACYEMIQEYGGVVPEYIAVLEESLDKQMDIFLQDRRFWSRRIKRQRKLPIKGRGHDWGVTPRGKTLGDKRVEPFWKSTPQKSIEEIREEVLGG